MYINRKLDIHSNKIKINKSSLEIDVSDLELSSETKYEIKIPNGVITTKNNNTTIPSYEFTTTHLPYKIYDIDFTQLNTKEELHNYLVTLPIYYSDRILNLATYSNNNNNNFKKLTYGQSDINTFEQLDIFKFSVYNLFQIEFTFFMESNAHINTFFCCNNSSIDGGELIWQHIRAGNNIGYRRFYDNTGTFQNTTTLSNYENKIVTVKYTVPEHLYSRKNDLVRWLTPYGWRQSEYNGNHWFSNIKLYYYS